MARPPITRAGGGDSGCRSASHAIRRHVLVVHRLPVRDPVCGRRRVARRGQHDPRRCAARRSPALSFHPSFVHAAVPLTVTVRGGHQVPGRLVCRGSRSCVPGGGRGNRLDPDDPAPGADRTHGRRRARYMVDNQASPAKHAFLDVAGGQPCPGRSRPSCGNDWNRPNWETTISRMAVAMAGAPGALKRRRLAPPADEVWVRSVGRDVIRCCPARSVAVARDAAIHAATPFRTGDGSPYSRYPMLRSRFLVSSVRVSGLDGFARP